MQSKTKTGSDTTMYGDYVTVWQKQADGSWKYVADTGNDTPHEVGK
jgi:ketosteroid isomerase-like protein